MTAWAASWTSSVSSPDSEAKRLLFGVLLLDAGEGFSFHCEVKAISAIGAIKKAQRKAAAAHPRFGEDPESWSARSVIALYGRDPLPGVKKSPTRSSRERVRARER